MLFGLMQLLCKGRPGHRAWAPTGRRLNGRSGAGAPAPRRFAEVRPAGGWRATMQRATVALCMVLFGAVAPALAAQGDKIVNRAEFTLAGSPAAIATVTVTLVERTPSTIELLEYAPLLATADRIPVVPSAYRTGSDPSAPFTTLPAPTLPGGSSVNLAEPVPLTPTSVYHRGEPVFIRVTDGDQNLDRTVAETVLITLSDDQTLNQQVVRLTETGPDTGIFVGYIQSTDDPAAASYGGLISLLPESTLTAVYTDRYDGSDTATSAALVDPFGRVFDSHTGLPVDGATITLLDADTGAPATVFGDDGVSTYPATVVSGTSATDSSGILYTFKPGSYRFPMVLPGHYQLQVTPPGGYAFPSTVSTADLQDLPTAPFAIANPGSRGEVLAINPGPAIRVDLPVDPSDGGLWLQKTAGKRTVGVGDFVPYQLRVETPAAAGVVTDVTVSDRLPAGFRYRQGSCRLDGVKADDPQISADGRTLTFHLDAVTAGNGRELCYVAEVAAGAKPGPAVNTARASGDGDVVSNQASATVTVQDQFLRSTTFLAGQVIAGSCGADGEGVAGVRIYLEDGSYVLTDKNGRYHFEGLRPGTHVVQLDLDSLPEQYQVIPCEQNSRFAGRSYSQFVDLQGGTLWQADFHVGLKPPARGEAGLVMSSTLDGDGILYTLHLHGATVPLQQLRLNVSLPPGIVYRAGSARLDGAPLDDPEQGKEGLAFPLGAASGAWQKEITFRAATDSADSGDLTSRARLRFDTPAQPDQATDWSENVLSLTTDEQRQLLPKIVLHPHFAFSSAELGPADRDALDRVAEKLKGLEINHIEAIGHTDNIRIAPEARNRYADNFALSEARAKAVVRYLAERLNLPPAQITITGLGDTVPVASNATPAGRAQNRRVELQVLAEKVIRKEQRELIKGQGEEQSVETTGLRPGESVTSKDAAVAADPPAETPDGILSPVDGTRLANRIAAVRVSLDSRLKPVLTLDGKEIPAERIGFKMEDKKSGKTLYSYIGVDFGDKGKHLLKLQGLGPFGNARFTQEAHLVRTGEIAVIRQLDFDGNTADGKTPVKIHLQMLDANGEPVNAPTSLEILSGSLKPVVESQTDKDAKTLQANPDNRTVVQIDSDGWASFAPTQTSGRFEATLGYGDRTVKVETYVKPQLRDWILVGLAEGTAGYNTVSGHVESLPGGIDENLYENGRMAFFAKGQIKGEWLLTMAYDSAKPGLQGKSLYQTIDPNSYYTLYGDTSTVGYDAASASKLYLKIERDQYYALFGDFNTGMTVTELSLYSRSLTGLKTELNTRHFAVNAFASDTAQNFAKDEIRGDGTSGLYHLSKKNIVINSEKITIETRDRFRSEVILSSVPLTRFADYDIDYDAGTLFFKAPVMSKDENLNPIFIVVDYETAAGQSRSFTYGGRAAAKAFDGRLEVGASTVHEGADDGNLYGVDGTWKFDEKTELHAEAAKTRSGLPDSRTQGSAWLAELKRSSATLNGSVYYREQEAGFGLGQQNGSETGTRKFGLDGDWHLSDTVDLHTLAYRQDILGTGAREDVAQTTATYTGKQYTLMGGLRQATDTLGDGQTNRSNQMTAGATWKTLNDKLLLRINHDQSIGGSNSSANFPTRTTLGADYSLTHSVAIFGEQEFTSGANENTRDTRVGFKSTPWSGGQLTSSLGQGINESGTRMFAEFGLNQTYVVNEHLSLSGSLDRSQTLRHPGNTQVNGNVPSASGASEDFTAVSLGATYKMQDWTWDNRLEYRTATTQDKWGLFSGIVGQVSDSLGLSARVQYFLTDSVAAASTTQGDLTLGLAYRPFDRRWIVLDRLDLATDRQGGDLGYDNWRIVNNLNANYRPNTRTQFSFQYGAKYVQDTIDATGYSGFTDLLGLEGRYDLTTRWDVGLHGSLLHSWSAGQFDYSSGASVGYNVMQNAWVSLGYNLVGFTDPDFSAADYTAQGPFIRFRVKFDQASADDLKNWLKML